MDFTLLIFDTLIISCYILLISFLSVHIIRFIRKRYDDLFIYSTPIAIIILCSSFMIMQVYGGATETIFFFSLTILSFILVIFLLFFIFIVKKYKINLYQKWLERLESVCQGVSLKQLLRRK